MNGSYKMTLPLPGGGRECHLVLEQHENALTGHISNPYAPEELCPLFDGTANGNDFQCKAMVGRTEFVLEGVKNDDTLNFTLTTHETIPLEPGRRLAGNPGELAGEYLVGVYSPGGVKENHFLITGAPGSYSGEMYCLMDEKTLEFMKKMMSGGFPGAPGKPDGPDIPDGPPPALPKVGDKCDVNPFLSVAGDAKGFEITTKTGNGSLFVFTGSVQGDAIPMTLQVTDVSDNLCASRS